jgi:heme exporter protein B
MRYFSKQLRRHTKLLLGQGSQALNPLLFFFMVVTLFPLGLGPSPDKLAVMAPGILWVVALLANLTISAKLFYGDFEDGTLEQAVLSQHPLSLFALAEILIHWLVSGVLLALTSPVFALMLNLPKQSFLVLVVSLLLGSLSLCLIGAVGAALTVGLKRGGLLLSLLIMPLYVPVLVFGTSAVTAAVDGSEPWRWVALLGAFACFSLLIAPVACALGLRISLDA